MSNSKTLVKLAALALTAALLSACGGGGDPAAPTQATIPGTAVPTTPNVSVTIPASTYAAGSAELAAWTYLQNARVQCGFGSLQQNAKLDAAALAHQKYLTSASIAGSAVYYGHGENDTTNPNYTGSGPSDRALAAGYGTEVAEILDGYDQMYPVANPPALPSMGSRGQSSMRNLLNTVYHLQGAMYFGPDVGIGASLQSVVSGSSQRDEYRFGLLDGFHTPANNIRLGAGTLVTYPCQSSTGLTPVFVPAYEQPNPFPTKTDPSQTVGTPIYLKVDAGQVLVLTSNSVSTGGTSVATQVLTQANDPAHEIGANEVFVVPSAPLQANSTYQVILTGTVDGKAFNRNFLFTTGT